MTRADREVSGSDPRVQAKCRQEKKEEKRREERNPQAIQPG
jgi:hypothetical protein